MPYHLHIRTNRFPILDGEDDELINPGTYGKSFAQFLQTELSSVGYSCPAVVCEDWGWWVSISLPEKKIGLACYREHDENENCEFACSLSPKNNRVWSWSRFRFVDLSDRLKKLADDLRQLFARDPEIELIAMSSEFPNMEFKRNGDSFPR